MSITEEIERLQADYQRIAREWNATVPALRSDIVQMQARIDRLSDALSGLIDWCKEGCPDGGTFTLTEARAALANVSR